jgi:membrane protease YdiL (CAAX protease family)
VAKQILAEMLVFEVIDTVIVLFALVLCRRISLPPKRSGKIAAWLLSVPLLAISLGANVLYHQFILWLTDAPLLEDEVLGYRELFGTVFVLFCVQPAVVEELFARYMLLGVLRRQLSTHAAVWISALAFGLLHLAAPLSFPYLIAFGAVLGYLRLASGSLLLPMLVHFAHNLAVVGLEMWL